MSERKCGRCGERGHRDPVCPKNPMVTIVCPVLAGQAEILWHERLSGIWRASSVDENPVRAAMLSAYLQGALDGQRPEVTNALADASGYDSDLNLLTGMARVHATDSWRLTIRSRCPACGAKATYSNTV